VDLDHTTDPDLIKKQVALQDTLNSYSEISPSGKGLHVIVKADLKKGRRKGPFEFYSNVRFMTMTGKVYNRQPVVYAQTLIETAMEECGISLKDNFQISKINSPERHQDLEIYNSASGAKNGQKFISLWNGDFHTYHFGDQSRADFALIDILAFYTQNRNQVERMFLQSGLGQRDKAKRKDYVGNMVSRSFDNLVPEIDFSKFEIYREPVRVNKISQKPSHVYAPTGVLSVPPGLTGEIASFVFQQSHKPVQEMAITAALGLMSGITGRAYNVSGTGLNLYMLLLARTGRGKEEMAKGINKLLFAVQQICPTILDFSGPGDLASGQALLRYLTDHPTKSFVSVFGEFGIKLKTICSERANSADLMLQKVMLDLYNKSGATDKLMPTAYSDAERNTQTISSPAFTMIGESTPDWFYDNVNETMINSGLLPRFCVMEYLGPRPRSNPMGSTIQPVAELIEGLATQVSIVQGLLQANQRYPVGMTAEAKKLSEALDQRGDDEINSVDSGLSAELWNRAHLKTLRIAAVLAVGKNPYQPEIDSECFAWAENFIVRSVEQMKLRFDGGLTGNNTEQQQLNNVKLLLGSYLNSRPDVTYITDTMYDRFVVPMAYIVTKLSRKKVFVSDRIGPIAAIRRTLKTLIETGELMEVPPLQAKTMFQSNGKCFVVSGDMLYSE